MSNPRQFNNRLSSPWTILAAALAILCAVSSSARATPFTFAQFHETPPGQNTNLFAYFDNGVGSDAQFVTDVGNVKGAPIPVSFNYLSILGPLPADLSGNQDATVTLTSSTLSPVVTGFGGAIDDQQFTGLGAFQDVLTITRDTPAAEGNGTRTNLLTVTFTGELLGSNGGTTPQLSGNTNLGFVVNYTSDFLDFSSSTAQAFSLTFSSWSTNGGGGLSINPLDNYFNSATAAGAGTFDAESPRPFVPEPCTLALGTIGLAGLLVGVRARKRKARTTIG